MRAFHSAQALPRRFSRFLAALLLVSGCSLIPDYYPPLIAPAAFPDTEIVFDAGNDSMGFVNSDGSGLETIRLFAYAHGDYTYSTMPVMTEDNSALIFLLTDTTWMNDPLVVFSRPSGIGVLAVARQGQPVVTCENWTSGRPILIDGGLLAFHSGTSSLGLYELQDCGVSASARPIETLAAPLRRVENPDSDTYSDVPAFGYLSPNRKYLTAVSREIVIQDLTAHTEVNLGPGDFPSWSPDSEWLSYVGADGIFLVRPDGTDKQLVFANPYSNAMYYQSPRRYVPPWPDWSPDGQWLVFHLYLTDSSGSPPEEIPIYKLNVQSGELIHIVDYGLFPSWNH